MSSHLRNVLAASLDATPAEGIPVRFSTTFHNCPEEGRPFWALTAEGVKVRIEANDHNGMSFAGRNRDYTRADLLGWWLDADDLPGTYVLSERQERAEYEAAIEDNQRQYEEE